MKVMLSQPMGEKTVREIAETRNRAIEVLTKQGHEIINTWFSDEWYEQEKAKDQEVIQRPIYFLAKSLEKMSLCNAVYFCKGWENARGCKIEHDVAVAYGLGIIYEE